MAWKRQNHPRRQVQPFGQWSVVAEYEDEWRPVKTLGVAWMLDSLVSTSLSVAAQLFQRMLCLR